MKVVPLKPRPLDEPSDEELRDGLQRLGESMGLLPFGFPGAGLLPPKGKPMSEAVLAHNIQALLDADSDEWPPLYRRVRLKDIVRLVEEAEMEGEPVDLVGLVAMLEWDMLLSPLDAIKRLLNKGLGVDGPLALTADNHYVIKSRDGHAARGVP
jgi:hypothetical protein